VFPITAPDIHDLGHYAAHSYFNWHREGIMAGRRTADEKLDESLKETFPSSDSIAPGIDTSTEPSGRPIERHTPPITHEEVEEARTGNQASKNRG
jgi:hypothetical protein